jgi:hypothetical protein
MEEKTKKKRVQKRAVRKKTKGTESVSVAAVPEVKAAVPEVKAETKKPRKSSKAKPAANTKKLSRPKAIVHQPTHEQVQLRAYFISERRLKLGLPGDESHDWLTAEKELRAEHRE